MNCRRIENLLSAYLDGELDEDEKRSVDVHLSRCGACQREIAALSQTKQVLAALAGRTPRSELERLLTTDVSVVANRVAHHLVSPRTIAAALLSVLGIWAASRQLARSDNFYGPPLPSSAYAPVFGYQAAAAPSSADQSACALVVGEPASVRGPYSPAASVAAPAVSYPQANSGTIAAAYFRR